MSEVQFGNLKDLARTARANSSGPATGNYRGKLVSLSFDALSDGRPQVISEWITLEAYGANDDTTLDACVKSVGKKAVLKFLVAGKGSEVGLQKLAAHLEEVCKTTGHDLGQYQTIKDMKQLFLELNAHTVIRELSGKWGKEKDGSRSQFKNWYIKKDRQTAAAAPAAQAQGNSNWNKEAPAPEKAPEAAPAPTPASAAPAPSAAASLFGGE